MRSWLLYAVGLLAAVVLISGCGDMHRPLGVNQRPFDPALKLAGTAGTTDYGVAVDLVAGRNEVVGTVRCWITGDSLYICYSCENNWVLAGTHLIVAASLQDIPLAGGKNPKVGHFPLKKEHTPPATEYRYSLSLDTWGLGDAEELVIAAHADVQLRSGGGGIEREEGAWGAGEPIFEISAEFPDRIERPADTKEDGGTQRIDNSSGGGGNWAMYFTVDVFQITVSELMINEIFYCGSDYATFYFYDQYVELFNSSEDTLYLDGIILTRQTQTWYPDLEEVDFVRAIYAFQFPGTPVTGREHPIAPGQFVVIATDAIDHTLYCSRSIDLSNADWECFNPLGSDYDNPAVPNIVSIHPTRTTDYLLNLSRNAVVIATGEEYSFEEYAPGRIYVNIPIRTIIDGVEYSSNPDVQKLLTVRVDAGFAGIGCTKYSARSTERREPGLDTNNSTFDFLLTPYPTPGYSYSE
jgi:hypothetical protein